MRANPAKIDSLRGTGRTTTQINAAPHGAFYLWCHHDLTYPSILSVKCRRWDLKMVSPTWMERRAWRGLGNFQIVTDHAFHDVATLRQLDAWAEMRLFLTR